MPGCRIPFAFLAACCNRSMHRKSGDAEVLGMNPTSSCNHSLSGNCALSRICIRLGALSGAVHEGSSLSMLLSSMVNCDGNANKWQEK